MSLLPTRQWVKEHLSAFICCETSPIASLWIRLFVLVCPECRKEHHDLKQVWDHLEGWETTPPADELENNFSRTFRQKFPAAFEDSKEAPLPRTGDFVLRFAYTSAIVVLGAAVFLMQESPNSDIGPIARVTSTQPVEVASVQKTPATSPLSAQNQDTQRARPVVQMEARTFAPYGVPVSLGPETPATQPQSPRFGRTGEVQNLTVNGFETLMASLDPQHSY